MKHHQAHAADAVRALYAMTARHGGWIEMRYRQDGEATQTVHHHCATASDGGRLAERLRHIEERHSLEVSLTLPRPQRGWGTVPYSTVLWARVEGADQEARARRLRPFPSLVLREGASTRRLLVWALSERLPWDLTVRANKRIAYALRAVQKHADPDRFEVAAPGTFLRVGRSRPVAIVVDRLRPDFYSAHEVVGRLKDPPENSWIKEMRAG